MAKPVHYYGIHAVSALLSHRPMDASQLFIQQGRQSDAQVAEIISIANAVGISVQYASKDALTKLSFSPQHQGVVIQARPLAMMREDSLLEISAKPDCLLLVLDQVTDAHNLGACLRTALAMGVDAVVCPKHHSASLTPTVAKVSVGAMEAISVIAVTNLARSLSQLKEEGVFIFGTALTEEAKPLHKVSFEGKVAIVMGSEGEGMRWLTAERCDELIYIPMKGISLQGVEESADAESNLVGQDVLESLNVSVATGMVLYEVSRQRCVI